MIYITGRLNVENLDHYKRQFDEAKEFLQNYETQYSAQEIVSLFDVLKNTPDVEFLDPGDEADMRLDLVRKCDTIYVLKGYEGDETVQMEITYAYAKQKRVSFSKTI